MNDPAYVASEAAIDAARSRHIGGREWAAGTRPLSGREMLRLKIERAVRVEIQAGRLAVVPAPAGR